MSKPRKRRILRGRKENHVFRYSFHTIFCFHSNRKLSDNTAKKTNIQQIVHAHAHRPCESRKSSVSLGFRSFSSLSIDIPFDLCCVLDFIVVSFCLCKPECKAVSESFNWMRQINIMITCVSKVNKSPTYIRMHTLTHKYLDDPKSK